MRLTSLVLPTLGVLLLSGCAEFNSAFNPNSIQASNPPIDPYARADLDELLNFGDNLANISPSSRAEICGTLLQRQKDYPGTGIQLHLLTGRLFSESCGDISEILDGVAAIPPGSTDKQVQQLAAIEVEALKRANTAPVKKCSSQKRKQKSVKSTSNKKSSSVTKDSSESNKDETRLLREKLEAIRSMEKHLDETDDGN